MDSPLVALVLAGGTGTRLYPATRSDRPKQFLSFGDDESLLARTVERARFADETYVLTREAYADEIHEHAPDAAVLTEPEPKDTGPALVYATHRIREQVGAERSRSEDANGVSRDGERRQGHPSNPERPPDDEAATEGSRNEVDEPVVLVLPSDHLVSGDFRSVARRAASAAVETEGVITVGVEPTRPEPGYGYIEPGTAFEGYESVDRFHEKPDESTARTYLDRGFYWNAGMFAWTPTAFLREARESPLEPLVDALDEGGSVRGFDAVEAVSVDHAVLERSDSVFVVPADFEWDDLGAWNALARVLDHDETGNAALGETCTIDAAGNVVATDGHVSLVGVEDLVVASFGERTLVLPKSDAQRVRAVVATLREQGRF